MKRAIGPLLLVGCVPQVQSEGGQLVASATDVPVLGAVVLEGTRTCPTVRCASDCPPTADPLACFEPAPGGVAELDGACWQFPDAGSGSIEFTAVACPANAEGYAPADDRFGFEVLTGDAVAARPVDFEATAELLLSAGPAGTFPSDWRQPPGEPWRVLEDRWFTLVPRLWAGDVEVAWTVSDGVGELRDYTGAPPVLTSTLGAVTVELEEGSTAEVGFRVGPHRWPLAEVVAVADTEPASIQVVVAYGEDVDAGTSAPVAARAVVRDAAGGLLWGGDVAWTLDEGLLALGAPEGLPSEDYVYVTDACVPPSANGGPHTAVLRATLGSLTATAELAWTVAEGLSDDGFAPSPDCRGPEAPDTTEPGTTGPGTTDPGTDDPGGTDPLPATDPKGDEVLTSGGGCGCATGADPRGLVVLLAAVAVARRRKR